MRNKKGDTTPFSIMHAFMFVLGAVAVVFLVSVLKLAGLLGSPYVAEASTKAAVDDLFIKAGMLLDEEAEAPVASGYVEEGTKIVGFDSNQRGVAGVIRKDECGALSNSCICACKGDNCGRVLKCKGFSSSKVTTIRKDGSEFVIEGGRSLTLKLTLSDRVLNAEDIGVN